MFGNIARCLIAVFDSTVIGHETQRLKMGKDEEDNNSVTNTLSLYSNYTLQGLDLASPLPIHSIITLQHSKRETKSTNSNRRTGGLGRGRVALRACASDDDGYTGFAHNSSLSRGIGAGAGGNRADSRSIVCSSLERALRKEAGDSLVVILGVVRLELSNAGRAERNQVGDVVGGADTL